MPALIIAISVTTGLIGSTLAMMFGLAVPFAVIAYLCGGMLGAYAAISMAWRAHLLNDSV